MVNEIRKQPMFLSGIDEIKMLDEQKFQTVRQEWLTSNIEINTLLGNKDYQKEFAAYKKQFSVSAIDLRKFS